mmetsp:Transcript_13075/g.27009  ORF Transcript_13075/g.27009 Transcript_13075/m.27009 type:complete len:293 (-) Transcript_13075:558-1436(-)
MPFPSSNARDNDLESRWEAVVVGKSTFQKKMTEGNSVTEKINANQDGVQSIQEEAYGRSLAIAQEEVDILKAELENALRALSGSNEAIENLKQDLKSKETCLATVQLENELLAFELGAKSNSTNGNVADAPDVKTSTEITARPERVDKSGDFVDFADFEDNLELIISRTESTSIMSNDESSIFTSTMNSSTDASVVDLDFFDNDGESTMKSMIGQSQASYFRGPKAHKIAKLLGNSTACTSLSGRHDQISPLTTICHSSTAEIQNEGTKLCLKCSEIRIGFIENEASAFGEI